MNKLAIEYERTIHSSYMKFPAIKNENLDVRIMLQKKLSGMIAVERCYINGKEQYWYDISGKQALDSYVKINTLEYSVFEILLLRICEQLEVLEWNLLDENGLMIDPEYIFLNHKGEDISFVFYPEAGMDILKELQKLMEYLLRKLNHADRDLVEGAYEIYELVMSDGCQIQDLKSAILKRRLTHKKENAFIAEAQNMHAEEEIYVRESDVHPEETNTKIQVNEKWMKVYQGFKQLFVRMPKEEVPIVVYPDDEEELPELVSHPTVCIASSFGEPRGVLIYEGMGDCPDFELGQMSSVIGKGTASNLQIPKETISHVHAKIEYLDAYYIEDMNSTNGTYVNEELLNYREKRALNPGDVIRFADVKYRFL